MALSLRTNASGRPEDLIRWFWSNVDQSAGSEACWPWTAGRDRAGYGTFRHGGKHVQAHRFALEQTIGRALAVFRFALHHCDNPPCCNPAHLYEGTTAENAHDASIRGRAPQRQPRFPDTPWGRLRRSTGWSLRELAERTSINVADLSRIERGIGPTPDHARRLLAVYDGAR